MKKVVAAFLYVLSAANANADLDITPNHEKTTTPANARYEIVQSQLAARWTFKLDRVCGNVYLIVKSSDESRSWQQMHVFDKPACQNDGRPRYQLFTSGLAARHTYLMNTETGKTWIIVKYKTKFGEDDGWESID